MGKVAANKNPEITYAQRAMMDDAAALDWWEQRRWGDNRACLHCGSVNVYAMTTRGGERDPRGRWQCREKQCRKQYTVKVGTVMQDSNIPLRNWVMAMHFWTASKKGFAAKQFQRMSGLSYKSALFLAHRVREAMADDLSTELTGVIEVDETYVGGKPRKATKYQREKAEREGREIPKNKRGRGTKKVPVLVMVERGGRVRASPMASVTGYVVQQAIRQFCDPSSRIVTDEFVIYKGIGAYFEGGHRTVKHKEEEYVRYDDDDFETHTNTAEGFNSLLKRGLIGIYHSVSPKHLHRYVSEAAWRYSERHVDDGARMLRLVRRVERAKVPNRKSAAL